MEPLILSLGRMLIFSSGESTVVATDNIILVLRRIPPSHRRSSCCGSCGPPAGEIFCMPLQKAKTENSVARRADESCLFQGNLRKEVGKVLVWSWASLISDGSLRTQQL